jgi:enterochelin esterase-like enzyme
MVIRKPAITIFLMFILLVFAAGCLPEPAVLPEPAAVNPAPAAVTLPVLEPAPTLSLAPIVTLTATVVPSATPTLEPTVVPSETPFVCSESAGKVERFLAGEPGPFDPPPPLTFRIYTPPCYAERPDSRYPVLYIIHGQTFADDQWDRLGMDEAADMLISSGQAAPFLIVMPLEQYTLPDPFETMFGYTMADELVPWIDQHFSTCSERECRAIGGLSRGGGWALHMGFVRWQTFGAIGAHSAPVFINDPNRLPGWLQEIPRDQLPRIYLDNGRLDWYREIEREYEALLTRLNVPHEYYLFEGAHDEAYWSSHVESYVRWYTQPWLERVDQNPNESP